MEEKNFEFNSLEELCDKLNEGELKTGKFTIDGATIYRPNGISIGLDEVVLISVSKGIVWDNTLECIEFVIKFHDNDKVHYECVEYDHKVIVEAAQEYVKWLKDFDFKTFESFIIDEAGSKEYYNYFVMKYLEQRGIV